MPEPGPARIWRGTDGSAVTAARMSSNAYFRLERVRDPGQRKERGAADLLVGRG